MSGIFEELEMFDEGDKVVTRQAIAAATKRLNDNFGGFLRQASNKKEFESRLALVDTDINNMVADVVTEYGGDAEKIASAVKETVKTAFTPTTPAADEPCSNCGGHGYEHCSDDPEASKTASEDRPERLEAQDEIQLAEEHSQVNPWLKKQIQDEDQEDGGNLRNKEANLEDSQPVANPVPFEKQHGTNPLEKERGGDRDEFLSNQPSAIGTGGSKEAAPVLPLGWNKENEDNLGVHPLDNPRGASSSAHTVEKKGDEFVVVEDGGEEAAGPFNSKEKAQARAKELNELENLEKEAAAFNEAEQEASARSNLYPESGDVKVSPAPKKPTTCPSCNGEGLIRNNTPISEQHQAMLNELGWDAVNESNVPVYRYYYDPCPNCADEHSWEGSGQVTATMKKALALKEAAARGEKRSFFFNKPTVCPQCQMETEPVIKEDTMGPEKVCPICDADMTQTQNPHIAAKPETGDSTEKNEKLPTGNEDAHDGPSPKMDKTKWKPNATNPNGNLEPIKTEGENSPHPTRQMDIKQKPDYQNDDPWEHDNNVWEREELPTATEDEAGFEGTRNIDQPTKAAETFPDKGQTNPVTREALAGNERVAIFENERDILEENVPENYAPSREGIMSELADLKQRLIEGGSSPEEAEAEIKNLVMGMWRTEQSPEELGEIGIEDIPSENDEIPAEDVELDTELTPEGASVPVEHNDTELSEEGASLPAEHDVDTELSPEGASVPVDREIEDIIERGDDDDDRVEVIHDEFDEEEEKDPLGFDDPDELDEDEDEDIPFDEELSEEELDRLLKEEEYDDEDLFL
jgi:hypothetical protein